MRKKTLYWLLAVSLQTAVSFGTPLCIYAANFEAETGNVEGGVNLTEINVNLTGWHFLNGNWYFYHVAEGETSSKCVTGWHWIDGYCYFFDLDGKMLSNTTTPDGYQVSESGAWMEMEKPVYYPGTGIITKPANTGTTARRSSSGGSGGSGGGGSASRPGKPAKPEETMEEDSDDEATVYFYTIQYQDIVTKKVLRELKGHGEKDCEMEIEHPYFDNYIICEKQPETMKLTYNNQKEYIYYRLIEEASPSNAAEISWEVRFTDAETNQKELLPAQKGKIQEGSRLVIQHMERIIADNIIWEVLEKSPFEIEVYGPGNQFYIIEYEQVGELSEPEDPYEEEREQLENYLKMAKEYESSLTGENPASIPDSRFLVTNKAQNDARVRSITNHISDTNNYVFYVIGKNYKPNGITIAEWFGQDQEAEYSSITEDTIQIEEDIYTIVRMSIMLRADSDSCTHIWGIVEEYPASCVQRGSQMYACDRCGEQVEAYVPALGHVDEDSDTICDQCGESAKEGEVQGSHWNMGDIQVQELDGEIYFFECIDQNYSDEAQNQNQVALFLCTSIIPADYGSTYQYELQSNGVHDYIYYPGQVVNFGSGNDYKYSNIRKWLKTLERDTFNLGNTNIGVSYAYMGSTGEATFEHLTEADLRPAYIGNQKMADQLFILSVDEALKYRNHLWNIEETGSYSKGYWLRSPMGTSSNHDTGYVYIVDIVNGNIRPQAIKPSGNGSDEEINITSTAGVRPAYTMSQN